MSEQGLTKALTGALKNAFSLLSVVMVIVLILFLSSGIFVIEQFEEGLVIRLGKIVNEKTDPIFKSGLHIGFPQPIDIIFKFPVGRVLQLDIHSFWYKKRPKNISFPEGIDPTREGYVITGDMNIIHSKIIAYYRVVDLLKFYKNYGEIKDLVKIAVENACVKEVGKMEVDKALRTQLEVLRSNIKRKAQANLRDMKSGIKIVRIDISNIPPFQVKKYFDGVINAEQKRSEKKNKAKGYKQKIINEALGERAEIISDAENYRATVIAEARSDAEYIRKILEKYKDRGELEIFLRYLRNDRLQEILKKIKTKFFLRSPLSSEEELRIIVGRPPKIGTQNEYSQ